MFCSLGCLQLNTWDVPSPRVRWRDLPEAECQVCHTVKPISEYYVGAVGRECKECEKTASRAYKKHMPPEVRERNCQRTREYKAAHPAEIRVAKRAAHFKRRHAGVKPASELSETSLSGKLTTPEWNSILAAFNGKCAYCDTGGEMQIEHIVAVAKGGTHTADNIVPSCPKCNKLKNTHDLRTWLQDEDRYQFICDMRSLV